MNRRPLSRAVAALVLAAALSGCATATPAAAPVEVPAFPATTTAAAPGSFAADPVSVTIGDLDVDAAPVVPVGVAADGSMQVPDVRDVGWFRPGPEPGEPGVSVMAGHVNYDGRRGPFARLSQLRPGAEIAVADRAGTVHRFRVTATVTIPKSQYAARTVPLVFARSTSRELRLVTCGGQLSGRNYLSNVVVSAVAV